VVNARSYGWIEDGRPFADEGAVAGLTNSCQRQVGDNALQLAILFLNQPQPPHLRRQQAVVFLLPVSVEVGRLADPGLAANVRHRHAVGAPLENERLLDVR
jgi:hypothetical protein